jgi:(E)-4-hydroxy-3-methylbut-2-enyl-diphosphate synthase
MNKPEIIPQNDVAGPKARHQTTQVMAPSPSAGGGADRGAVDTNTDTADVDGTIRQAGAGAPPKWCNHG